MSRRTHDGRLGATPHHDGPTQEPDADACVPAAPDTALVSCLSESPHDAADVHGPLDAWKVDVSLGSRSPSWTIRTRSPWSPRRMWDVGYVVLAVDTFGRDVFDYHAIVRSTGTGMRGLLF